MTSLQRKKIASLKPKKPDTVSKDEQVVEKESEQTAVSED